MNPKSFLNFLSGFLWLLATIHSPLTAAHSGEHVASYTRTDLLSDSTDSDLVNPWGLAFNPNGPAWVADNGSGLSTLYDGKGSKQALVVSIPPPLGGTPPSAPTGLIANLTNDFKIGGPTGTPSVFIFATEDGTIAAWSGGTDAVLMVDNSASGAIYKGLAMAGNGSSHFLYATDFHHGKVDVFDASFSPHTLSCSFSDSQIPADFAPFGIHSLNGTLYVTYAKQDADKHDDVAGRGNGFVDAFDADGCLIDRVASRGALNSPWGVAIAPANFGGFSDRLLVGNFGDGRISAFDLASGNFRGQLRDRTSGKRMTIDGLWGLAFGNGVRNQPTNTLFFTAGPNGEANGLFGKIVAAPGSRVMGDDL